MCPHRVNGLQHVLTAPAVTALAVLDASGAVSPPSVHLPHCTPLTAPPSLRTPHTSTTHHHSTTKSSTTVGNLLSSINCTTHYIIACTDLWPTGKDEYPWITSHTPLPPTALTHSCVCNIISAHDHLVAGPSLRSRVLMQLWKACTRKGRPTGLP